MKLSEFIEDLEAQFYSHGDVEVRVYGADAEISAPIAWVESRDAGKVMWIE